VGYADAMPGRARDVERLTQLLMETLRASGYVKPRAALATEEKLRRMVRRMKLSTADAEVWFGMVRQVAWKLGVSERKPDTSIR
jgi:tRNA/rRNA methyltransferase